MLRNTSSLEYVARLGVQSQIWLYFVQSSEVNVFAIEIFASYIVEFTLLRTGKNVQYALLDGSILVGSRAY